MQIIGTGLSGLVGTQIVKHFDSEFRFENLSLETGIDITDYEEVASRIEDSPAPWIFHLAAVTDVDGVEKEKESGEEGKAWRVNVEATKNIVNIARKTQKHVLYISTDYVFSGDKDFYKEEDEPRPLSWYGRTKWEGEKLVNGLKDFGLIVRIANPYGGGGEGKKDFVAKLCDRLRNNLEVKAPTDQFITPTFLPDIAAAILRLVRDNVNGVYHVVGADALSPYDAAVNIANEWQLPNELIMRTMLDDYLMGKAKRPRRAVLKHDKIDQLGIGMRSFREGLKVIHIRENKSQ